MVAISYRATLTAKFKHSLPISLIYDTYGQKHVCHHILDKYGAGGRVKTKALDAGRASRRAKADMQRVPSGTVSRLAMIKSHAATDSYRAYEARRLK